MYLAAYGTLKQGFGRWPQLDMEECEVVGTTTIKGSMYRLSWFPAMVEGDNEVEVEVIKLKGDLDTIVANLDWYEGVAGGLFRRTTIDVDMGDKVIPCIAYMFNGEIPTGTQLIKTFK